jgi:hypothetical protein
MGTISTLKPTHRNKRFHPEQHKSTLNKKTSRVSLELFLFNTTLHSKADRGDDEESTSRSMPRRQQRYANEGDLV